MNATAQKRVVSIPADYFFKMASREYANWPSALAREFIQNSVDAGATSISITTDDGWVLVSDNGCGMSADTITDALLTLGGSKKDDNATGGFGKAKELLYFSWPEWTIHSRDNFVSGEGSEYTLESAQYRPGTISRCYLGIEKATRFASAVTSYVRGCLRTPGRTITLNGEDLTPLMIDPATLEPKGSVDGLGEIWLQTGDAALSRGVYVLINGLYMFYSSAADRGTYIVQLAGKSYDLLTANRDGFNAETRDKFDQVIKRLAIDSLSAQFQQKWTVLIARPRIVTGGGYTAAPVAHAARSVDTVQLTANGLPVGTEAPPAPQFIEGRLDHETIAAQLIDKDDTPYYADILDDYNTLFREGWMFLSHEPFKRADLSRFNRRSTKHTALIWKAVVDHVADTNNIARDYGLGFVNSPTTEAAHFNGYILLNLDTVAKLPNNQRVIKMLTAAAEELTHLLGYTYHDEAFKSRYTQLLEAALFSLTNHRDFIRYANYNIGRLD